MQITFYQFRLGDVDDIDIYAAMPIYEWQQTDHGRWVMTNATDLVYRTQPNDTFYGHHVIVEGRLEGKLLTEYFLKWNKEQS